MISLNLMLDMIATDAVEGGPRDHYFDESRNREYMPPEPERCRQPESELPPMRCDLQRVKRPDGSYEWVD